MPVSHFGHRFDIDHAGIGIAQALDEKGLRVFPDSPFKASGYVGVDERHVDAKVLERMGEKVVGAAIKRVCGDDVVPRVGDVLDGVGHGSRSGRQCQGGYPPFEGGDAPLKYIRRGVHDTGVDVAGFSQVETRRSDVTVREHIGRRLVNGYGARVGGGVGLFLADVKLQGFKSVRRHLIGIEARVSPRIWRTEPFFRRWMQRVVIPPRRRSPAASPFAGRPGSPA